MLKFDRKQFRSGVMIVKEPETIDGVVGEKVYGFRPNDKGKTFEFIDESYILSKYAIAFTIVE
jgi:hypothetical protein